MQFNYCFPFTKNVLVPLGLILVTSAVNVGILGKRGMVWKKSVSISANEMSNTVKSLKESEKSRVLLNRVTVTLIDGMSEIKHVFGECH